MLLVGHRAATLVPRAHRNPRRSRLPSGAGESHRDVALPGVVITPLVITPLTMTVLRWPDKQAARAADCCGRLPGPGFKRTTRSFLIFLRPTLVETKERFFSTDRPESYVSCFSSFTMASSANPARTQDIGSCRTNLLALWLQGTARQNV